MKQARAVILGLTVAVVISIMTGGMLLPIVCGAVGAAVIL